MIPAGSHLIVAAHPDDEVLGAGGWMARHPGTRVAIASEGVSATHGAVAWDMFDGWYGTGKEAYLRRRAQLSAAADRLGAKVLEPATFPDQRLETVAFQVQEWIDDLIATVRPAVVLTHSPTDLNRDHRVVAEAVAVATRPYTVAGSEDIRLVLGFSVDSVAAPSLAPAPANYYLGLTEAQLAVKLAALAEYADELRLEPHPRSLAAVERAARLCGDRCGRYAAEPYTLIWGRL